MEYVFYMDWADPSKNDLIGRRGELLNIALEKDIKIQKTCVVTRNAFQSFLLETGIKESIYSLASGVDHTSSEDMKRIHQKIREKIMEAEFPWDLEMELSSVVKVLSKDSPLNLWVNQAGSSQRLKERRRAEILLPSSGTFEAQLSKLFPRLEGRSL